MAAEAQPTGHVHPIFGRLEHVDTVAHSVFELADAVRALAESAVVTDVSAGEMAAVADEVRAVTRRLGGRWRPAEAWFVSHGAELFEHLTQAATGRANPHAFAGRWLAADGSESYLPVPDPATGESVYRARFTRSHADVGPDGPIAGHGPVALLLDHVVSFANAALGDGGMTVSLILDHARSTPIDVTVLVRARRTHTEGRKLFATGEIWVDGSITASAKGIFVSPQR